jgi:hypothetical protein
MRGMVVGTGDMVLFPNTSGAETQDDSIQPSATGFSIVGGDASATHIYIAIRRGPMKVPTTGTSVFAMDSLGGTLPNPPAYNTSGWPADTYFQARRANTSDKIFVNRLTGGQGLRANTTGAEFTAASTNPWDFQDGVVSNTSVDTDFRAWMFRRAPGFMDVCCYTGTGTIRNQAHNLGAAPELIIVKRRDTTGNWRTRHKDFFGSNDTVSLNTTTGKVSSGMFTDEGTTSTTFPIANDGDVNASGGTYVAYLFATCPGVSKVGSFTGNGSSQTLNMGFTGGARFFLVKRTDSTGDWWVYDSARGIVSAADPALRLNSTAAEVTSADAVDTDSTGLIVNQESTCNINVNGATYIYLGIS